MRSPIIILLLSHQVFCKVFERCELVRELSQKKHRIPEKELATWICIARHESEYNTSAIGHLNADGSGDHGLLQISDQYWCSPPGNGLACGLNCDQLEDDDITDDVICARRIYRAHKRRTGDGFTAWAVYGPHCRGDVSKYTAGCEDLSEENTANEKVSKTMEKSKFTLASVTAAPTTKTSIFSKTNIKPVTFDTSTGKSISRSRFVSHSYQKPSNGIFRKHTTNAGEGNILIARTNHLQSLSRTSGTSSLDHRPTLSDVATAADPDPKTAWFKVHYDPRFLDEFP